MKKDLPWDSTEGVGGYKALDTDQGVEKTPVVFIHGNNGSFRDWSEHIRYFLQREYRGDELWSVDISNKKLTHKAFAKRIEDFVNKVLSYTERDCVNVVTHSLGVTSSRYWMKKYDRYSNVDVFVGIAGANHGLPIAPPEKISRNLPDNSVARPGEFLSTTSTGQYSYRGLNKESETPGNVEYYTIRGSKDKIYSLNIDSPKLEGAECNIKLDEDHFGVRDSEVSKELIYQWCH